MADQVAVELLSPGALRDLVIAKGAHRLIDVRTDGERRNIPFFEAEALEPELEDALAQLPRETPLVFICYRGVRSVTAAQRYQKLGFSHVYSLDGGVEAYVKALGRPPQPQLALSA